MSQPETGRSASWKWYVCGLLFLATMLNYMDRQTLSLTIPEIRRELGLSHEQYGSLEMGFGLAFAAGGLIVGLLVDWISVRWMYPAVLLGWSAAGLATAYAQPIGEALVSAGFGTGAQPAYLGFMVCRVALGLFEAGQWPCALVTSQRLLSQQDRTLGNSVLQSGASIGAILTPIIVQGMVEVDRAGSWRGPFQVIGALGMLWIIPWLAMIRARELAVSSDGPAADGNASPAAAKLAESSGAAPPPAAEPTGFWRRFLVLVVVVITINACWHFFRAWLPTFLRDFHGYSFTQVNLFVVAFYIATDVGCISVGVAVKALAARGWQVHSARMATFFGCALLTTLSLLVAVLPAGPLLLAVLLVVGFGALGLFANYYSFTQELSVKHQGKLVGALGAITWICTAFMQKAVGVSVDETGSYRTGLTIVGLLPLLAFAALWLFWREGGRKASRRNAA